MYDSPRFEETEVLVYVQYVPFLLALQVSERIKIGG